MADASVLLSDPLLRLRQSIASKSAIIPTTAEDASEPSEVNQNLATATHLLFAEPTRRTFDLDIPTRFISSENPVDLRSIYFAWLKKDVAIPDYIASAQKLNEELSDAAGKVQNLVFVERLDLITWLEGASEESEYIKPLGSEAAAAQAASLAQVASGAAGGIPKIPSGPMGGRPGKPIDPRMAAIYRLERRTSDRNILLRGIKPTVSGSDLGGRFRDAKTERGYRVGLLACTKDGRGLPSPKSQARTSTHPPSTQFDPGVPSEEVWS